MNNQINKNKWIRSIIICIAFNILSIVSIKTTDAHSLVVPEKNNVLIEKNFQTIKKSINDQTIQKNNYTEERKYLLLVYMAADNDLHPFSWENIKQLARGANDQLYIIVQLNEPGTNKPTQRYLIEKNKAILLNRDNTKKLDSGNPNTLIDFVEWSVNNFPAQHVILDLWDHATGICDPQLGKLVNPSSLFVFNPTSMKLELDRSYGYLDLFESRGICFDETFKSYLTNEKLTYALEEISHTALNGGKLAIIGLDACLEAMIELASIFKKYAHIQVSSQEVEYGAGWRYDKILKIFEYQNPDPIELAQHMVQAYHDTYARITNDYTLSAIDLSKVEAIENNINEVSLLLLDIAQPNKNTKAKTAIRKCLIGISFDEPTYIDLVSFYLRLISILDEITLNEKEQKELHEALDKGIQLVHESILANTAGKNLQHAHGISIYFAKYRVHASYSKTEFAQNNRWVELIGQCLAQ